MRKVYYILFVVMLVCVSCEWQFRTSDEGGDTIVVDRYDRIQSLYLTTGDFSALQQMNTSYPMQTRTLIEDVLHIGKVNDQQINKKRRYRSLLPYRCCRKQCPRRSSYRHSFSRSWNHGCNCRHHSRLSFDE